MAYPLAYLEQPCSTPSRRDGHTRGADALPAHTTHRVLAARGTWAPGPAGQRQGATGVRVGVARPVDGPRETALELLASTWEALIPKAKAREGERSSISRLQAGESQNGELQHEAATPYQRCKRLSHSHCVADR